MNLISKTQKLPDIVFKNWKFSA